MRGDGHDILELSPGGVLIARPAVRGNGDGASPVGGGPRRMAESLATVSPVPTAAGQRGPVEDEAIARARRGSVAGRHFDRALHRGQLRGGQKLTSYQRCEEPVGVLRLA